MRGAMLSISRSEEARPPAELGEMRVLVHTEDDAEVELLNDMLVGAGYTEVVGIQDPERAVELVAEWAPDLLLLGVDAPGDLLAAIGDQISQPDGLPVLVLSADATPAARQRVLEMGARDFVSKPIDAGDLLLRIRNLLQVRRLQRQLRHRNTVLTEAVRARTIQLDQARLECLTILAAAAEYRDDETREHTQRVGRIAALIARALDMDEADVALIRDAAPLHDIGKVGIPDYILLKPGRLTSEERQIMTHHVEIGAKILAPAGSPVLMTAATIARTHHERWDGSGYLAGLGGDEIPLVGRITAVADVFDALTHDRPYKAAWDVDRALAEIAEQAGQQFDPHVARVFAALDPTLLDDELE
jgi:putative two-component system response regulator